jgi:hypothetical protein
MALAIEKTTSRSKTARDSVDSPTLCNVHDLVSDFEWIIKGVDHLTTKFGIVWVPDAVPVKMKL